MALFEGMDFSIPEQTEEDKKKYQQETKRQSDYKEGQSSAIAAGDKEQWIKRQKEQNEFLISQSQKNYENLDPNTRAVMDQLGGKIDTSNLPETDYDKQWEAAVAREKARPEQEARKKEIDKIILSGDREAFNKMVGDDPIAQMGYEPMRKQAIIKKEKEDRKAAIDAAIKSGNKAEYERLTSDRLDLLPTEYTTGQLFNPMSFEQAGGILALTPIEELEKKQKETLEKLRLQGDELMASMEQRSQVSQQAVTRQLQAMLGVTDEQADLAARATGATMAATGMGRSGMAVQEQMNVRQKETQQKLGLKTQAQESIQKIQDSLSDTKKSIAQKKEEIGVMMDNMQLEALKSEEFMKEKAAITADYKSFLNQMDMDQQQREAMYGLMEGIGQAGGLAAGWYMTGDASQTPEGMPGSNPMVDYDKLANGSPAPYTAPQDTSAPSYILEHGGEGFTVN